MSHTKNKYHTDLIFSNILFGMNYSYMISLVQHYIKFQDLFFLQIAASAIFFIPFTVFSKKYRMDRSDITRILIVTLLVIYGWMYMMLWGARYTNPIDASLIATLGPVFTLLAYVIMDKKKFDLLRLIGLLLSGAGAVMLLWGKGHVLLEGTEAFGNGLIFVSVISVAINTVIIKPVLEKHGTMVVMGWYYIIGVLITAPFFMKGVLDINFKAMPTQGLLELSYILILGTILPTYLLYKGTEKLTSVHTALYRYIQPLIATALALWRGQETLTKNSLIAAGLIFLGVIFVVVAYNTLLGQFKRITGIKSDPSTPDSTASESTPAPKT